MRQRQGKKRSNSPSPHGADVTQATSETAMPKALGRLPIAPEVNSFQAEISRDQPLMSRRNAQNGTVISHSKCYFGILGLPGASKSRQKLAFGHQERSPGSK